MTVAAFAMAAAFTAIMIWLISGVRRIGAVSSGSPIAERAEAALLLIDLQTVFWERGPYSDAAKSNASAVIQNEVQNAKAAGMSVIAIRQEWSIPVTKVIARLALKGQAIEGTSGTEIAAPFVNAGETEIVKRVQDAFETGALDDLLAKRNVGTLRLVGLDFNYCVQKTALAARNRGYAVTIVSGGTLSAGAVASSKKRLLSEGVTLQ